ncbi:tRNA pseudouridine(38-40) synthase TruA [Rickettsiales endosymbiont of Stachyamoeba lipophora]|uniref:tRNA pseudouridine(38-40) synthase TruA n=1 Tax=Rickettsiales endosymbiont of Stachyamoeba lipophora TaxID=2486578 RepID=UPI000F645EAD|nr:tRNA pseudouridine(38-40) synthase TruA [Rickettsiales endosymbiont of Stachyamoeba lipophora]AZL15375.1 tRNA pseudouridine(38-40) synthase TruA [Rickettsiales endosymbiont of Stachyamoeba lipophora]
MPIYKLTIEYNGTNYCGWQRQNSIKPSIQQSIEEAISKINLATPVIFGAGRTDAGVHAVGQVAHVRLDKHWNPAKLTLAINAHLKIARHTIRILQVEEVGEDFHARFSAIKRYYKYKILNRFAEPSLEKNLVWHVSSSLNVDLMEEAAYVFAGKHDFTSFRATHCQAKNPVITLDKIKVYKQENHIYFELSARSFLHHMVRNIVGALKKVGDGSLAKEDIKNILELKDRNKAPATAPACGLYFCRVDY